MQKLKKVTNPMLILLLTTIFTGSCLNTNVYAKTNLPDSEKYVMTQEVTSDTATTGVSQNTNNNSDQNVIFKSEDGLNYKIYTSKNIDTFLIAAGVYTNFDNPYIFPYADEREVYSNAKKYFQSYKDHPLIKKFAKYMNGKDVNSGYMAQLLSYSDLPEIKKVYDSELNISENDMNELTDLLKSFYTDTNAEAFFTSNVNEYTALGTYIRAHIDQSHILSLIKDVEAYTGNKNKYYGNHKISYSTVISFYRNIGSFSIQDNGDEKILSSIQFPYRFSKGSNEISMNNTVITSIHEFLHKYVNDAVASNNDLIMSLTSSKDKKDYTSEFYVSKKFPWNRITDECFVRAIEARIYKNLFSEEVASRLIIEPETKQGFKQVRAIYNKLAEYENNRDKYPTIDDFMPELIKEMYK